MTKKRLNKMTSRDEVILTGGREWETTPIDRANEKATRIKMMKEVSRLCQEIQEAVDQDGPYSHNIISLCLRQLDKIGGRTVAMAAIEEYDLEATYGITGKK